MMPKSINSPGGQPTGACSILGDQMYKEFDEKFDRYAKIGLIAVCGGVLGLIAFISIFMG